MDDTSPAITQKICEMIQLKTPIERLKMGCSMYATSKSLIMRSILLENPCISKEELRIEFFLRFYGNDFDSVTREKIISQLNR